MGCHQENIFSDENVVKPQISSSRNGNENWAPGSSSYAVETKGDASLNKEASADTNAGLNREGRFLLRSEPAIKRSKIEVFQGYVASEQSKVIRNMFYKTKLCYKFQIGTCPYITNCNFAHSYEELREPPPNWQEIVAAHQEEKVASSEPNVKKTHAGTRCMMFFTRGCCAYGENCKYLHHEDSEVRESEAICLLPGTGAGVGCNENKSSLDHSNGKTNHRDNSYLDPSMWKTRICFRWELSGYCPYGRKCHFAHGPAELRPYVEQPADKEVKDPSIFDTKHGSGPAKSPVTVAPGISGAASRSRPNVMQNSGKRPRSWKGPDKISKIYGDWIDDL